MEQGPISQEDFENMLDYYAERYNLIGADEYHEKAFHDDLQDKDVCVTFDDNLLCPKLKIFHRGLYNPRHLSNSKMKSSPVPELQTAAQKNGKDGISLVKTVRR